jgi:HAD superfamily hydrolase (TIGR01484 family)
VAKKLVVALDIDGTQYSFTRPAWDAAAHELADTLNRARARGEAFVIHNTGRPYPWVCHGAPDQRYLNPIIADADAIISHSGTVIWKPPFDKPWEAWREHVATLAPPETVARLKEELQAAGITMHPETADNEFKICCQIDPARQNETVQRLRDYLAEHYGDQFEVFYWNADTADITPKGANKNDALQFLRAYEGLDNTPTLVGGDSLNDLPVLQNDEYRRVLVGNAMPEMKAMFRDAAGVYIAPPEQPAAQGIIAGMRHFGFLPPQAQPPQPRFIP